MMLPVAVAAQRVDTDRLRANAITVSGEDVDALRLAELSEKRDFQLMLRSPSSLILSERRTRFLGPHVAVVANSAIPLGRNDGALWSGRGLNVRAIAGGVLVRGPLAITLLPELLFSANQDFNYVQAATPQLPPTRNAWANPWNTEPYSIDAPVRFGDRAIRRLHPGQSSIVVGSAFQVGAATENEWWGPGIRNAIVLSDNAAGFPHVFLRTGRPVRTRLGAFDARLLVGGVRESRFFDSNPDNDIRSLSGMAATWSPDTARGFTVGFARLVLTPVDGWSGISGHALRVFTAVGTPEARQEQITSVFARVAPPGSGFETYVEWARNRWPRSLRDFRERVNDSQGYTVGMQWRGTTGPAQPFLAVQLEHTHLEHGPAAVLRPQNSYYTNRFGGHGYTHEGEVLGAAVGQGSSGQWLAIDYFRPNGRVGVFTGRTRWNNDAFIAAFPTLQPQPLQRGCYHDVTLFGGVRASWRRVLSLDYTMGRRINALLQWEFNCAELNQSVNVTNHSLALTFTPRW